MKIFVATLLLTLAAAVTATEYRIALVQPKETPLVLAKIVRERDLYAEYRGEVEVSGTLLAEWPDGKDNRNYKEPDYWLVPDASSAARLPHFARYGVRQIELKNGAVALRLAVGDAKAESLLNRKVARVKASGSFLVRDYSVGVECDAPWAKATMVSATIPDQGYAAVLRPIETC